MSDRILVFVSNPGRVVARSGRHAAAASRLAPALPRQLVDNIYVAMTRGRGTGQWRRATGNFPGTGIGTALPNMSSNSCSQA